MKRCEGLGIQSQVIHGRQPGQELTRTAQPILLSKPWCNKSNGHCASNEFVPIWDSGRLGWFPEELDWLVGCSYKGLPERIVAVRNPIGANMSYRRDVFERVGYFEKGFGRLGKKLLGSEEAELSMRLLRNQPNSKIVYDPSAIVYHNLPPERKRVGHFCP